jgi:hypothetical protein
MMWFVKAEKTYYTTHRSRGWKIVAFLPVWRLQSCRFREAGASWARLPFLARAIVGGRRWVPPSRFLGLRLFADFMSVSCHTRSRVDKSKQSLSLLYSIRHSTLRAMARLVKTAPIQIPQEAHSSEDAR